VTIQPRFLRGLPVGVMTGGCHSGGGVESEGKGVASIMGAS